MKIPDIITLEYLYEIKFLNPNGIHPRWSNLPGIGRVLERLHSQYPFVSTNLAELVFCLRHDIKECPHCKTCGDKLLYKQKAKGYGIYCSDKCYKIDSRSAQIKREATMMERYGVTNAKEVPEFQAKAEKTLMRRRGVKNPSQSPTIWKKIVKACLKKYGTERPSQNIDVKHKTRMTIISRYGLDWWKESCQKMRELAYEKHGTNKFLHKKKPVPKSNWELPDVLKDNDI